MLEPKIGDYVRYKLEPSGVPGEALLTEEGHNKNTGERTFAGLGGTTADRRKGLLVDIVVRESDIVEVVEYASGPVSCWSCGHDWVATRPASVAIFECPSCGEMMGAA